MEYSAHRARNVATTAAFIAMGYASIERRFMRDVYEDVGCGQIELVCGFADLAEEIQTILEAEYADHDYPGVFDYEVSEEIGIWYACEVERTHALPDPGDVRRETRRRIAEFFAQGEARIPAAHRILSTMADVGLGYLTLGQPLTTLSGGERQRIKLASQMGDPGDVYVLDEPTTGLHLADVDQLLGLLDRLVDDGKSVIVIEHHQAVMAHADWIIDLGPGAGHDGGRVVFEGTPSELVASRGTLTGEHLAGYVSQ